MKLTYQELENNNNSGGGFLAQAANAAKGAVCGAYHDYKDWYHSNIDLAAPPGALLETFWNGLCPLEPPYSPPPPSPAPFTGGQCCDKYYDVYGFIFFPGYPPSNTEQKIGQSNV